MLFYLAILFALISVVNGLGCMVKVCGGNEKNEFRRCPDSDGTCGNYHSERSSGEIVDGVDIRCPNNSPVYAPFDGEMFSWRPFGGAADKACADNGTRIEGTGQWQGYAVHLSSVKLEFFGGKVKAGDELGKAIDRGCYENSAQKRAEPYVELKLYREGKLIDPTYHLQNCMCTGQICESNPKNKLIGEPFKSDKRFNGVRGWEIECRMIEDEYGGEKRAPMVLSPIDGELLGRTRLVFDQNGAYSGCDNDGMFIVGTGEWIGFEVRLYNVKTREDLGFGRKRIVQGEPIGSKLVCDNSPESIFVEVRYQGRVVDISDMITAEKCQLPQLPDLFR
ncbi:peptidase, M23 family [Dictyocaulus viviparus]|uniref:Peptidase, M23 family n=1 Tax=Dictyocaulus viviparus TaxID=29172 RepID=A0A0D8XKY4_DICVI|nr:peptidase, M23 family [Dictyocaulus viviparus]